MKSPYTVLIVEDEKNIRDIVKAYLLKENYCVLESDNGRDALDTYKKHSIHLIILDLMLPYISGEQVCKLIRQESDVPIIMLTAKVEEQHLIDGITIGADDYVRKPFKVRELMVRVSALLRRAYKDSESKERIFSFNQQDLMVNLDQMTLYKKGNKVEMTPGEFKILSILVSNRNKVLSREQIIGDAFGNDYERFNRTIDTHIKNIRYKIEDSPKSPIYIKTIYGTGYQFIG